MIGWLNKVGVARFARVFCVAGSNTPLTELSPYRDTVTRVGTGGERLEYLPQKLHVLYDICRYISVAKIQSPVSGLLPQPHRPHTF